MTCRLDALNGVGPQVRLLQSQCHYPTNSILAAHPQRTSRRPSRALITDLYITETHWLAKVGLLSSSILLMGVPQANAVHVASGAQILLAPFSTVTFRRDPDFVDRGDTLAQIDQRCSQPGGRAALVGLGGVGYTILILSAACFTDLAT